MSPHLWGHILVASSEKNVNNIYQYAWDSHAREQRCIGQIHGVRSSYQFLNTHCQNLNPPFSDFGPHSASKSTNFHAKTGQKRQNQRRKWFKTDSFRIWSGSRVQTSLAKFSWIHTLFTNITIDFSHWIKYIFANNPWPPSGQDNKLA